MAAIVQARPRCKLKVRGGGKFDGETVEAAAARNRADAIAWYNRKACSGSPAFVSVDRKEDGRCFLYLRGPKLCKAGGTPRNLRTVDAVFYAALRSIPGLETYVTAHGYHVARFPIDPALFASIPLYPADA